MEEQNALFSFHADPASSTPPWLQLRKRIAHLIETGFSSRATSCRRYANLRWRCP